jgi:hypothetical protein
LSISRFLVTGFNNGYFSASGLKPPLNGGSLPTEHSYNWLVASSRPDYNISERTAQKTLFLCFLFSCCRSVVAYQESAAQQRTLFSCLFRGSCLETNVVSEPFAGNGCFSGLAVLAFRKYATIFIQS